MNAPVAATPATFDCRQAFAETLIELARTDERIVAVCNDSVGSSNLGGFQKAFGVVGAGDIAADQQQSGHLVVFVVIVSQRLQIQL